MANNKVILNLGCGNDIIPNATNHDKWKHREEIDCVFDLEKLPWPWGNDAFDIVIAKSVIEHLTHPLLTSFNEIWRIMKPGGLLSCKLPYWKADITHDDLTHIWPGVGTGIFNQLDPTTGRGKQYWFYTPYKWQIVEGPKMNIEQTSVYGTLKKMPYEWKGD